MLHYNIVNEGAHALTWCIRGACTCKKKVKNTTKYPVCHTLPRIFGSFHMLPEPTTALLLKGKNKRYKNTRIIWHMFIEYHAYEIEGTLICLILQFGTCSLNIMSSGEDFPWGGVGTYSRLLSPVCSCTTSWLSSPMVASANMSSCNASAGGSIKVSISVSFLGELCLLMPQE